MVIENVYGDINILIIHFVKLFYKILIYQNLN